MASLSLMISPAASIRSIVILSGPGALPFLDCLTADLPPRLLCLGNLRTVVLCLLLEVLDVLMSIVSRRTHVTCLQSVLDLLLMCHPPQVRL